MYYFIVNPAARSGQGEKTFQRLLPLIEKQKIEYQVFFTRYQGHATKITRELTSGGRRNTLIVVGGDGTVNEVINGISDLAGTMLAYIPVGSGNDLARGLGLPTDPAEALLAALSAPCRPLDVGCVRWGDKKRRFLVSAGMGFDAAVCQQVMLSPLKALLNRLHLGKLTYTGVALRQLYLLYPQDMTLILDDHRKISLSRVYFATVMNLPCEGGGFRFCKGASPLDGRLDVIAVCGLPKPLLLLALPLAYAGLHTRLPGVYRFTCRSAEFISQAPLAVHTDGEPLLRQPRIKARLENEKLLMKIINK